MVAMTSEAVVERATNRAHEKTFAFLERKLHLDRETAERIASDVAEAVAEIEWRRLEDEPEGDE